MTKREQLIQWLGDAHAMEVGIVSTLEKHIADASGMPEARSALGKHLTETKRHAEEMKKALASLGGSHPAMKEGVSKLINLVAGFTTSLATDTIVKNGIADFATEHFEIACYNSLIFTATELGETKIAATCKKILKEEQAMAKVLERQFKAVNAFYLKGLEADKTDQPKIVKRPARSTKSPAKKSPSGKKAGR